MEWKGLYGDREFVLSGDENHDDWVEWIRKSLEERCEPGEINEAEKTRRKDKK